LAAKHSVIGFDLDANLVQRLASGASHIEGVPDFVIQEGLKDARYSPTTNAKELDSADVVVIAVPTPLSGNSEPDLGALRSASKILSEVLTKPTLIINESTSFPGTLRDVIAPIVDASGIQHEYAVSPERVDPGNQNFTSKNTPRVVGGLTESARERAIAFYRSFCDEVIAVSSPEVAEAAKLFENTFRFINIGLVNEFAQVVARMGIPVDETLAAAATKPYGFMPFHPNVGIGGHCIPVDPFYLQEKAKEFGISSKYIDVSDQINKSMPSFIVERLIEEAGSPLAGVSIKVIGVSYKANIADTRETPAEAVLHLLQEKGAKVSWHDPLVKKWLGTESSPLNDGAEIGLVLVAHDCLEMDSWNGGEIYTINRNPRYPRWKPLISVSSGPSRK
jgi:UDP-N-acetyl-D-glucosamine dehydrogenase